MRDDILGELTRDDDDDDGIWFASKKIAYLAQFGQIPIGDESENGELGDDSEDPGAMESELQDAMSMIQQRMTEMVGEDLAAQLFEQMQKLEDEDPTDEDGDPEEVGESDEEYEARVKHEEEMFRRGEFPISIEIPDGDEPSTEQKESMRLFFGNEKQNLNDIFREILTDFREASRSQPEWFSGLPKVKKIDDLKPLVRCTGLNISHYHFEGFAYIGLSFVCEWDQEHGLGVLWHPTQGIVVGAEEAAWDIQDADNFEEAAPLTPHQQLIEAFLANDEERVQELIMLGADINDFDEKDDYPPLCMAVDSVNVVQVQQLLAMGADPNKAGYDKQTPMRKAREVYKSVDLESSKGMMRTMIQIAMQSNPAEHSQMVQNITEIIAMLEEAGGK